MSQIKPELPEDAQRCQASALGLIVAAVDGEATGRVMAAAGRLAQQTGAHLVVAHVHPSFKIGSVYGDALVDLRRDLEYQLLTRASSILDPLGVIWSIEVDQGHPGNVIRQIAARTGADLLIVGTRGHGFRMAVRRLVRWSVSAYLIRHEQRPVLVVPPKK